MPAGREAVVSQDGPSHPVRKALGAHLISQGKLVPAASQRANRLAKESGERLELVLAGAGDYPAAPVLEDRLNRQFLREAQILPLTDDDGGVTIAMVDPLNDYAAEAARFAAGKPILRRVALPADFEAAF